jgi:hypothetical protein
MTERAAPDAESEREKDLAKELIEGGAELAGASAGAALGLIGGPAGALGGAAVGVTVTRALRKVGADLRERLMTPRETVRTGAAYAVAAATIRERLEHGDAPRSDGFFEAGEAGRAAAEELLEGVLRSAADAYEEQKVSYLGRLYASIAFDRTVSRRYANFLITLARRLTFSQMVLMAVLWEGDAAPMIQHSSDLTPPHQIEFEDEFAAQVDELERLGLLSRGDPGASPQRSGMTFVDAGSLPVGDLSLSAHGKSLYELMGLKDIHAAQRQDLMVNAFRGWPKPRR